MQLLERISQVAGDVKNNALTAYRKLVIRVARGQKTVKPAEAVELLRDAGKTPDELAADADLFRQRLQWEADIEAYEQAQADVAASQKRIAELEEERAEIVKRATEGIDAEIEELKAIAWRPAKLIGSRNHARNRLRETSHLNDEIERFRRDTLRPAAANLKRAEGNRQQTLDMLRTAEANYERTGSFSGNPFDVADRKQYEKHIEQLKKRLTVRDNELTAAKEELRLANEQFEELTAASLKA